MTPRTISLLLGAGLVWLSVAVLGTGCKPNEDERRERLAMQLGLSKYNRDQVINLLGKPDGNTPPRIDDWPADSTEFYWLRLKTASVYFGFDKTGRMVRYYYAP